MQAPHILVKDSMDRIFLNPFQLSGDFLALSEDYSGVFTHLLDSHADLRNDMEELGRIAEPIADSPRLTSKVMSNLERALFRKSDKTDDPKKYGKYLWLREFVKWIQNGESVLMFEYFSSDKHRMERDGFKAYMAAKVQGHKGTE